MERQEIKNILKAQCRLYESGSDIYDDNPFDKDENQFFWYLWMRELRLVNTDNTFANESDVVCFFYTSIEAYIDNYSYYDGQFDQLKKLYLSMPILHPVK